MILGLGRIAAVARFVLTLVALGDLAASLAALARPHSQVRSAERGALLAQGPVRALLALAIAAASLYIATRAKRPFQRILVLLLILGATLSLASGRPALLAVAIGAGMLVLVGPSLWSEESNPHASRLGWVLIATAGAVTAVVLLKGLPAHWAESLLTLTILAAVGAGVWGVLLLDRNAPLPVQANPGGAADLYRRYARSGASAYALMADKSHFWAADGSGFVAFSIRAGVALVVGPAIAPPERMEQVYREFAAECRRRGWRPAYYQVAPGDLDQLTGPRVEVGCEALLDLQSISLEGPDRARLRHEVARAEREGVGVQVVGAAELDGGLAARVDRLAASNRDRGWLGEMGFSVGRHHDAPAVERLYGLAFDREGELVAYVTWLLVPAADLAVLDEVQRGSRLPRGTMDLLLYESLQALRARVGQASLGMASVTAVHANGRVGRFLDAVTSKLGLGALSGGLYAFKAKFKPHWQERYLVAEKRRDLPRAALALFLVHYPALTRRWERLRFTNTTPEHPVWGADGSDGADKKIGPASSGSRPAGIRTRR